MPSIKTYFSDILNQPTMSFRCALIDDGHPIAWRPGLGAKLHYNVCNSNGQILFQLEWIKCHVAPSAALVSLKHVALLSAYSTVHCTNIL